MSEIKLEWIGQFKNWLNNGCNYHYRYPMPVITSDIIAWTLELERSQSHQDGHVLLVQRAKDPYKDCWALPGGHLDVDIDESVKHCAQRELREETKIDLPLENFSFVNYYDKIKRDPRGRYVSFAFSCYVSNVKDIQAQDDVKDFVWKPVSELNNLDLAFDHADMLNYWKYSKRFS